MPSRRVVRTVRAFPRMGRGFPFRPTVKPNGLDTLVASLSFLAWGQTVQRSIDTAVDYPKAVGVTAYLEVHGKAISRVIYARLKNVTTGLYVVGAEASSSSTSTVRFRSPAFTLDVGTNTYEVDFGGVPGGTFVLYDATLILVVT